MPKKTCMDMYESSELNTVKSKKRHNKVFTAIIIICILLATAAGCFVYIAFLQKEPDDSLSANEETWTNEVDGETFYYKFNKDNSFVANIGSVTYQGHYKIINSGNQKQVGVDISIGSFYSTESAGYASYTITGSRILGNRTMTCTYDDTYEFTLKQASKEYYTLELPKDFTPDEDLLGTWVYKNGSESDMIIMRDDGSITWKIHESSMDVTAKYSGIYRVEDSYIHFTYNVGEDITVPWSYALNGDKLFILGNEYVRADSEI